MNIIHTIILLPFFIVGWIIGYFSRSFIRGWFGGFYYLELNARDELADELGNEIQDSQP